MIWLGRSASGYYIAVLFVYSTVDTVANGSDFRRHGGQRVDRA
jgi:hypothetical protein